MGIFTSWAPVIVTAAIPSVNAIPAIVRILKRFMVYSGQTCFQQTLYPTFNRRSPGAIVSPDGAKYASEPQSRIKQFSEVNSSVHGNHPRHECHRGPFPDTAVRRACCGRSPDVFCCIWRHVRLARAERGGE